MGFRELAENLELEENEFLELVGLFVKTGYSDLNKLQSAIEGGDIEKAARVAHSIKGTSANLGLTEIFQCVKRIEMSIQNNDLYGATETAKRIKEQLDGIAKALVKAGPGKLKKKRSVRITRE
jgi:HPt (histidine-containing phosphotransfer) domain-containing protein